MLLVDIYIERYSYLVGNSIHILRVIKYIYHVTYVLMLEDTAL